MADNQITFGLKRQYGKVLGFIAAGNDRAEDLAHLAAVIRMFRPDEDLSAIRPIRPYRPYRLSGSRAALDILRASGRPMAARELARAVIQRENRPASDQRSIECSLHAVLARLEGVGVVREPGSPKRWRVG